jgi:hypothetical protein
MTINWEFDEKDISKPASSFLDASGCYTAVIKEFKFEKSTNGADQAKIKLEIEGLETTIYHIYSKTTGEKIPWKARHINHLLYLNKIKKLRSPSEQLEGVEVGVFLKAKLSQDKHYINFDLEGFFHPGLRKTAKELSQGSEPTEVAKMQKKYASEKPLMREASERSRDNVQEFAEEYGNNDGPENDEEFPF